MIDKSIIKVLTQKSHIKVLSTLLLEWSIIVLIFSLCIWTNHPILYLIGIGIISTRMYAFYSLCHEACHFHLFDNKKHNDLIANLFFAWPIFNQIEDMRRMHLLHHKYLLSENDPEQAHLAYPEFQFPLSKKDFLRICIKDLTGYNFVKYRIKKAKEIILLKNKSLFQIIYYVAIISVVIYFNALIPFFILWILPYITVYQLLNRIRLYYEHFHIDQYASYNTRTLHLNPFIGFFLAPYGIGYHAEHHAYPSVPYYNLRKLFFDLKSQEKASNPPFVSYSYRSIVKKIISKERL